MTNLEKVQAEYLAASNALTVVHREIIALTANKAKTKEMVNAVYDRFGAARKVFDAARDALDAAEHAAK